MQYLFDSASPYVKIIKLFLFDSLLSDDLACSYHPHDFLEIASTAYAYHGLAIWDPQMWFVLFYCEIDFSSGGLEDHGRQCPTCAPHSHHFTHEIPPFARCDSTENELLASQTPEAYLNMPSFWIIVVPVLR
jgi:hypothetical protein